MTGRTWAASTETSATASLIPAPSCTQPPTTIRIESRLLDTQDHDQDQEAEAHIHPSTIRTKADYWKLKTEKKTAWAVRLPVVRAACPARRRGAASCPRCWCPRGTASPRRPRTARARPPPPTWSPSCLRPRAAPRPLSQAMLAGPSAVARSRADRCL